jgi:hypothetical protein
MRAIAKPVPLVCLGIALVAGFLGNIPLIFLGLLCFVAAVGFDAAKGAQKARSEEVGEDLSPQSRTMIRPLKRTYEELEEVVRQNRDSSTIAVLGVEALTEAKRILQQSSESLALRDRIVRSMRGKYEADKSVAALSQQVSEAKTDEERASLQSAQEARKTESAHYASLEEYLPKIDSGIRQADAALAELKARLATGAAGERATAGGEDDLRESVGRLKALSVSYDEAKEMLEGNVNA